MYYTIDLAVSGEATPVLKWLLFTEEHRRDKVLKRLIALFLQGEVELERGGITENHGYTTIYFNFHKNNIAEAVKQWLQRQLTEEEYNLNENNLLWPFIPVCKGKLFENEIEDLIDEQYHTDVMDCNVLLKNVLD